MPLDALCLSAVREELAKRITGLKVDKVYQPERDVLVLKLRGGAGDCRLLFSAGAGDMRLHLTEAKHENPAAPPMFCMLLRKHLVGARITGLGQPTAERMLELVFDAWDEFGECSRKKLVFELIGRLPNAILVDENEKIIDCLRRSGESENKRVLFPGIIYAAPPPQQGKLDPQDVDEDKWQELFNYGGSTEDKWQELVNYGGSTADKWLLSTFRGLSPLICRELSWRAYGDTDFRIGDIKDGGAALRREFFALMQLLRSGGAEPWIITDMDETPRDFSFTRIMQYEGAMNVRREAGFSEMLDGYYTRAAQIQRVKQRASATTKTVKNARDRILRKLSAQREELALTERRDSSRECGDIIMANMHQMQKGQSILVAQDFYALGDDVMREIKLDPLKTAQQNAARYYKEYNKAKNAERYLSEQILLGEQELDYLESVLGEIGLAEGEKDLSEIRRELELAGYIKAQKKGKEKQVESAPLRFKSSMGAGILAGRNNTQNEKLTFKTAYKSDMWLHVQKFHGAHVIVSLNGGTPDETTLSEAAAVAAYYSSARGGGKVPVDYTLVKHVKKRPGGRPGMVIYTDYKTIAATPDEELVNRLKL